MKSVVALAVNPEYRNHGLGHQLVRAVEDWARETGAAGVRAIPNFENMNEGPCTSTSPWALNTSRPSTTSGRC